MQLNHPRPILPPHPLSYVGLASAAAIIPVLITLSPPGYFVLMPIELVMSSVLASAMMFIGVGSPELAVLMGHGVVWFCASISLFAYMMRILHTPTTR